jgi:hypothetical protein
MRLSILSEASLLSESGIKLTKSMVAFVNDATDQLYDNWLLTGKELSPFYPLPPWRPNIPIIKGEWGDSALVTGNDGLKLAVQIGESTIGSSSQLYWPDSDSDWGDDFEPFGIIYLDREQINDKSHLREVITHELVHLFDVRFRTTHRASSKAKEAYKNRYKQAIENQSMGYSELPTETDAILGSMALRRLSEMKQEGLSREEMQEAIKSLMPKYDLEYTLFRNRKQYRRYMQTLYRTLKEHF